MILYRPLKWPSVRAEWQLGHLSGLLAPTELIVVTVEETQMSSVVRKGEQSVSKW